MIEARKYVLVCAMASSSLALAQTNSADKQPVSEKGAITVSFDGGASFGIPAVQAVAISGNTVAISPKKSDLPTVGLTLSVRAWKALSPYVDFNFVDTGKATAQVGSVTATAQANTFLFSSGLRIIGQHSRVRPYAQFGGGVLYQNLSGSFSAGGSTAGGNAKGSVGSVNYGAGVQAFAGKHWGMMLEFDGYHFATPIGLSAASNAAGIRAGFFYQTKSSVE